MVSDGYLLWISDELTGIEFDEVESVNVAFPPSNSMNS